MYAHVHLYGCESCGICVKTLHNLCLSVDANIVEKEPWGAH